LKTDDWLLAIDFQSNIAAMGVLDLFGFLPIGILDAVDIILVSFLLYKLYELIRGTIAVRIFLGVLSIYLLWLIVTALEMEMMSQIFRQFINVGVIALIIVFQQEIRRFLLAIGNSGFFRNIGARGGLWTWLGKSERKLSTNIHAISEAVFSMASSRTGALIAIEREGNLQSIIDSGKKVNADLNAAILESVFFKNSPLHDGAVVIRGNKMISASCMFPLSEKHNHQTSYGMRHKAALGISEELDAVAVMVSEETANVHIVQSGIIETFEDRAAFQNRLQELLTDF
jgi:uncharacterized protein (TIGR00159 family)